MDANEELITSRIQQVCQLIDKTVSSESLSLYVEEPIMNNLMVCSEWEIKEIDLWTIVPAQDHEDEHLLLQIFVTKVGE